MVEQLKAAPERLLQAPEDAIRFLLPHRHLGSTFGDDDFGRMAERMARFFGTPKYIAAQTCVVILWVIFNGYSILVHFDKYPFIFLNLAFSTQAAYAAPLILLAQTRQASMEREKLAVKEAEQMHKLLEQNTALTQETKKLAERIDSLTAQLHATVCKTQS